ncbi:Receptor-like protein 35 [Citrus sinensis]|nr:Receptor-like protein 35 [Citrus sinensis]
MAAKHVVVKGSRIRIRSGQQVQINKDPWLPDVNNGFITTVLDESLATATVNSIVVPGQRQWDNDLVVDIFNTRDAALILQVRFSSRQDEGHWFWLADTKGKFIVRSCYNVLNSTPIGSNSKVWKFLWGLEVLGKVKHFIWRALINVLPSADNLLSRKVDVSLICPICSTANESVYHCLVECLFAQSCWLLSSLGTGGRCSSFFDWIEQIFIKCCKEECNLAVMVCWKLWLNRNDKVWNGHNGCAQSLVNAAGHYLFQWQEAKRKNFNIVEQVQLGHGSVCWVSHDYSPNGFGLIIVDRQALAQLVAEVRFSFVRRSANVTAHNVARVGGSMSESRISGDFYAWKFDCRPTMASWKPEEGSVDCYSWDVVHCNKNTGHVIKLNLSHGCLFGSINSSSSLFKLVHLKWLNLALNDFNSSEIPPEIINLSRLELQKPSFENLFEKLSNLKTLNLGDVSIDSTIPHNIKNLSSLTFVSLRNCELQGRIPSSLGNLSKLLHLDLSLNELQGEAASFRCFGELPISMGNLGSLKELDLSQNGFFGNKGDLVTFVLSSNNLHGPLPVPPPGTISYLASNNSLTGEIPSWICNLNILESLVLSHNNLRGLLPQCLGNFSDELSVLDLQGNNFSGTIPNTFIKESRLGVIDLSHNLFKGRMLRIK